MHNFMQVLFPFLCHRNGDTTTRFNEKQLAQITARSARRWRETLAYHTEAMLLQAQTFVHPVEVFIGNHKILARTAGIEGYFTSNPNKYIKKFLNDDEFVVYAKDQISWPGYPNGIDLSKITDEEERRKENLASKGKMIFNFDGVLLTRAGNGKGNFTRVIFVEFKETTSDIVYSAVNHGILRLAALKQGIVESTDKNSVARSVSIEYLLITKHLNESQKAEIRAAGAFFGIPVNILENYKQIESDFLRVAHF